MIELQIEDLKLYSFCPRLYWYYQTINKPSSDFLPKLERDMNTMIVWMYSYLVRRNKLPSNKRFDTKWISITNYDKHLNKDLKIDIWVMLRQVLSKCVAIHPPAAVAYPIKHTYKNIVLKTKCPVMTEDNGEIVPIFFRHTKYIHYEKDLQIRLCLAKLEQLKPKYAIIYNINPKLDEPFRYNLYTNNLNSSMFLKTANRLMTSVAKGPWHPRFECEFKECILWKECTI